MARRIRGFCVFCQKSIFAGEPTEIVVFTGPAPSMVHTACGPNANRHTLRGPTGQFLKRQREGVDDK